MFKRIVLFVITNLAVLFVLNITMRILGVDRLLAQSGNARAKGPGFRKSSIRATGSGRTQSRNLASPDPLV